MPKAAIPPRPRTATSTRSSCWADPAIEDKNPDADPEEIFGCTTRKHGSGDRPRWRVHLPGFNKGQTWSEKPALTLVGAARTTRAEDCDAGAGSSVTRVSPMRCVGVVATGRLTASGSLTGKLIVTKGDDVLSQGDCGLRVP